MRPTYFKSSLSNTNIDTYLEYENMAIEMFKTTPKMSSYLLAFVISEFEGISNGSFNVFATPNFIKNANYALDAGQRILKSIGEYVGHDYFENGMEKMTMAGIPDFISGGMENWGKFFKSFI